MEILSVNAIGTGLCPSCATESGKYNSFSPNVLLMALLIWRFKRVKSVPSTFDLNLKFSELFFFKLESYFLDS